MIKYFLTNDIVFKLFFRKQLNFLKLIINEITGLNIKEEDITFINNDVYGRKVEDKSCILDMSIKLSNGEIVIIEMQNIGQDSLVERFEYYTSMKIVEQLDKGINYNQIKKIYGIYFINSKDKVYNKLFTKIRDYDIMNKEDLRTVKEKNIINLTKIEEHYKYGMKEELVLFLQFMASKNEGELENMSRSSEELERAYETVMELNADKELQSYVTRRIMYEADIEARISYAEREAREKGHKEGIEKNQNSIIENMYNKNISIEDISEFTGISVSKVKEIIGN